jgi:PAS domain S-box-containing protein
MSQDFVKLNLMQTLFQSNLNLSKFIEAIEDGVYLQNLEKKIVHANDAFSKILGLPQEQIINKTFVEIFSQSNLALANELGKLNFEIDKEQIFNHYTGEKLRIKISPLYDAFDKVSGHLVIIRDITNVIQREREMARTEQLTLIGELAAGLAHELRNPLAGIQGAMDILIERKEKNDPDKLVLENARQEVWRIDEAIKNLIERSRLRAMKLVPNSLAKVAKSAVMLAQDQIAANVKNNKIQVAYLPSLDPMIISIDAAQIEDAILNLILNSIEAIENSEHNGEVTVKLSKEIGRNFSEEAVVEVTDNGRGIPKEHLAKIFNPFFSTKLYGTGLGLAAVRRILRAHNGRVEVTSIEGKGSTFKLYIPYK